MDSSKNLKIYLEELDAITPLEEDDIKELIPSILAGDDDAINKMIEGNLYIVPLRVSEFLDSGVNVNDLIQEGNAALIETIATLTETDLPADGDYAAFLADVIDASLSAFIAEESSEKLAANNMKSKANEMLEATKKFEEEHGTAASLEELSKILGMTTEDIDTVLRASYVAMENGDVSEGTEN